MNQPGRRPELPVPPRPGDPLKAETMDKVISAVKVLSQEAPGFSRSTSPRKPSGAASGRAEFRVFRPAQKNRLGIEPGSIIRIWRTADSSNIERPEFPTLEDIPLNELQGDDGADGYPQFQLTGILPGALYSVYVIVEESTSRVVLVLPDDPELEPKPCKATRLVASVSFEADDDELLVADYIEQHWFGSMEVMLDQSECSSSSDSEDSGGGSGSDDSGGGSDSGSDGSSDSSGGGSDGSDDSSGGGSDGDGGSGSDSGSGGGGPEDPCCPGVTLDVANHLMGSPGGVGCFTNSYESEEVEVAIGGYVGEIPCTECEGHLWVEFGIGTQKDSAYLGFGGGQGFGKVFKIQATACSEFTAWAQVRRFGIPIPVHPGDDVCAELVYCRVEKIVKMPPVCDEGSCSTDSGSSSGSSTSSSDSGGDSSEDSGGDSGSGDGSSKECVVPLSRSRTGFAALNCTESPETWFTDTFVIAIHGRETAHRIDPSFLEVCEKGSLLVQATVPDRPALVGAYIAGGMLHVECARMPWNRPGTVTVTLAGIRKGRGGLRFVERTEAQWERSKDFWKKLSS